MDVRPFYQLTYSGSWELYRFLCGLPVYRGRHGDLSARAGMLDWRKCLPETIRTEA